MEKNNNEEFIKIDIYNIYIDKRLFLHSFRKQITFSTHLNILQQL